MVTAGASINLLRRARWLAWATIVYNVIEAVVAIVAGSAAGSIALIGFGLDSIVEVLSALVIVWQLNRTSEDRERIALKLIALSFYLLASYVAVRALFNLIGQSKPDTSLAGIGLAVTSVIVMPILARAKRHTGEQLGSSTVVADSNQTKLCAYLSIILLGGLIFNATIGWWWADPIAALAIAALAINEGRQTWNGETCSDCC